MLGATGVIHARIIHHMAFRSAGTLLPRMRHARILADCGDLRSERRSRDVALPAPLTGAGGSATESISGTQQKTDRAKSVVGVGRLSDLRAPNTFNTIQYRYVLCLVVRYQYTGVGARLYGTAAQFCNIAVAGLCYSFDRNWVQGEAILHCLRRSFTFTVKSTVSFEFKLNSTQVSETPRVVYR